MNYDVTIGIPVYKSVKFVRRALESVLSQSYPSIEILLVDDFGNDGSMDVVREFQQSHPKGNDIRIITHTSNRGVSCSRNDIIRLAQGEFLYFMDSDDVISENTISILMQNIREYDAEIVFGSYEKFEVSGKRILYQYPSLQLLGADQLAAVAYRKLSGIQASACNYLVKLSLLRDHHLHFVDADYWEDLVFTFDLVTYISRAVLISDITYSYYCHENSLSHYQNRKIIPKQEILQNVNTIACLKNSSSVLCNKQYYPQRCWVIAMMNFYMAFHILKIRKRIVPKINDAEIKKVLSHPATLSQILSFRQQKVKNLLMYILGRLPAPFCLLLVKSLGKVKKVI